ncbi:TerB family tellurite resistance protein [Reichenbachiella agarivorans]|uniref:TerB family tellurite resistance protein n=1 Tax=Reichenbachiella agarivorans TaxID=2979464 RepID=A0ABY6CMX8_9BACT|nr:TerB family tellurite resistance protein [Reichenbachiella agarivorans]UXP31856.1 TerB family tellurite resistance protein [Reichenbachiella agarivorans]
MSHMPDVKEHLSLLVRLSKVDNFIAEPEAKLIHYIGSLHGLTEDDIEMIIDNPLPIAEMNTLQADTKFEYLFNLVQLMKVDGKVFQSEIDFCERIAIKLGYKPAVIADLSAYIYSDPNISTNRNFLRSIADEHLIPTK